MHSNQSNSGDGHQTGETARRHRVLLVEDNLDEQKLLRRILTSENVDVTLECNGQAAVDRILSGRAGNNNAFDLIVMDLRMPLLDGCGATRQLRSRGYQGAIAIITAEDDAKVRETAYEMGCDEFIPKPVSAAQLIETVQKYAGDVTQ